jgi:hypothetical protein
LPFAATVAVPVIVATNLSAPPQLITIIIAAKTAIVIAVAAKLVIASEPLAIAPIKPAAIAPIKPAAIAAIILLNDNTARWWNCPAHNAILTAVKAAILAADFDIALLLAAPTIGKHLITKHINPVLLAIGATFKITAIATHLDILLLFGARLKDPAFLLRGALDVNLLALLAALHSRLATAFAAFYHINIIGYLRDGAG